MSLLTRDYDYALPPELIARWPLAKREASRMMVLHRVERRIEHRMFADFPTYFANGENGVSDEVGIHKANHANSDLVVLNDTRVIPARVFSSDGKIELLFLEQLSELRWKCMVRPGKKMRVGAKIVVSEDSRNGEDVAISENVGEVLEILPDGERVIEFQTPVDLEKCGKIPLPPYMERAAEAPDSERYQTVYAREPGAVAAPTAGLHFTPEILSKIPHTFLTLHVGAGTFKPVQAEQITEHTMHTERFAISENAATKINATKAKQGRVIAVGTTTVRVLESLAQRFQEIRATESETNIFIYPPYEFKVVDALLTNFHLPKSTLLMLVSAFADSWNCGESGREFILRAYAEAIRERYRFYSYGDCMLIL